MNLTIEERLYLLNEMKERSDKNSAHLHRIPDYKNNRNDFKERSFYCNDYDSEFSKNIVSISVKIKFFIFRCIFCTLIFLGLYFSSMQNNPTTTKNISALSSNLKKDIVSSEVESKLQNTIIYFIDNLEK